MKIIYLIGHYYLILTGAIFNLWLLWRLFWKDRILKTNKGEGNGNTNR